jgi:peptidoglycan hydrolase-like protein with peptidoglycan-binding domain
MVLTAMQLPAEAGGAEVERAQQALKQMGHDPGPIDGVIGAQTSAAVRAYQKQQGLRVTGQLDAETSAKLGQPAAAPAESAQAPSQTQAGGDRRPNAVDPAQGTKTGANVGEGASYSRSNEKGQSTK